MDYRSHKACRISAIGFGCYAASGAYGSVDLAAFKRVVAQTFELGVTFFDVADAYGEAEKILGEVLRPYRQHVQIATKVGVKEEMEANLGQAYIRKACEESLQALRTDTIDLYQIHFDDPKTPVAETVAVMEDLKAEGKIRHYGLGHLPPKRVEEYFVVGEPFSVLMELSAAVPNARDSLLPLCREHDVGAIAFSVTGRGLLTGGITDQTILEQGDIRRIDPLFQRERLQAGLQLARRLAEIAAPQGMTTVQLAIALVLHLPGVICALTGPTLIAHLEENVVAGELELPEETFQAVDAVVASTNWRLRQQQAKSVERILTTALPTDPEAAFVDLIYAIEASVSLGLAREAEVLPMFQKLFALRENLGGSGSVLVVVQRHVEEIVKPALGVEMQ